MKKIREITFWINTVSRFFLKEIIYFFTVIKSNGTSRFGSSSSSADTGKNVAKNSILANCVIMYITPAVTHFQKAPYSDLKLIKIHVIYMCQN